MKKKTFINIRAQEVTFNGERRLRYKGSDGCKHGIMSESDGGSTALSIEEKTTDVLISNSDLQNNLLTIDEFIMKYHAAKIVDFKVRNTSYTSSSMNKIYFGNGIKGAMSYFYDITTTAVQFRKENTVLDEITKEQFTSDMATVKDFFERTIATIIDQLNPFTLYYFMKNTQMVIKSCQMGRIYKSLMWIK